MVIVYMAVTLIMKYYVDIFFVKSSTNTVQCVLLFKSSAVMYVDCNLGMRIVNSMCTFISIQKVLRTAFVAIPLYTVHDRERICRK